MSDYIYSIYRKIVNILYMSLETYKFNIHNMIKLQAINPFIQPNIILCSVSYAFYLKAF